MESVTTLELIKLLEQLPPEAEVYVATYCHGCYAPADKVSLGYDGRVVVEESGEGE